jgi:tripartite-type tricarboxylate transporter receptor subunit TctC
MPSQIARAAGWFPRTIAYFVGSIFVALLMTAISYPAWSNDYPARPVRIIVPYGAGGIADVTMRLVAERLSQRFDQQFFIDNRPGAGGVVGMKSAQEAAPDGYTLVMIGGGLTIAKSLFKSLPYDIEKDFSPISTTASYGLVITAKAGSQFKTVADIITAAKSHPGTLNFGTINAGSTQNLSAELFRVMAGVNVAVIPYKTTPELSGAVLRGEVDVAFEYFAGFQPSIDSGQMTVIATTARERAKNLPDVPTVIEGGLADYDVTSWNGLAAPVGTPNSIIAELNRAVDEALTSQEVQQYSRNAGMDAHGTSPEDLRKLILSDVAKWSHVIETAGIKKH